MHNDIHQGRSLKAPSTCGTSPNSRPLVMGGEEREPGTRRASRESRRSIDLIRKSLERSHIQFGRRASGETTYSVEPTNHLLPTTLVAPDICYLLISPLLPPVSSLATFFSHASYTKLVKNSVSSLATGDVDHRLANHPTLAIYGDQDFFVSRKKLQTWAEAIFEKPSSLFRFHEIAGAGHFWYETSTQADMRQIVREWVEKVDQSFHET